MVDIPPASSSDNSLKKTDYENWSKEQLIEKIRKLECHVLQLRNVIAKRPHSKQCFVELELEGKRKREDEDEGKDGHYDVDVFERTNGRKAKKTRPFDFSLHETRHVALKFLYLGWDFQGYVCQEDTNETIEAHLFRALTVTRLIEERAKSNYHRCGRTDKGVSAFQQVISLSLRSRVVDGKETLDYCGMLNRVLTKEIRMVAWAHVRPTFSARFDCNRRTYKYFFPREGLDLLKMQKAANYLIGEHDFRNLCKMDKDKTTIRRVIETDVVAPPGEEILPLDMCKLIIVGQSFVWHQIRCIAAVLILIGKGLEIIQDLLDLDKNPRKPQYSMAVDYPLVLYDIKYPEEENNEIVWEHPKHALNMIHIDLQTMWTEHSVKSAMIAEMMGDVETHLDTVPVEQATCLLMGTKKKEYQKLLDRPKCGS